MSRQSVERALATMPEKDSRSLSNMHPMLFAIGDQLQEDLIGILLQYGGAVLVTPFRLIRAHHDGSVQPIQYTELIHMELAEDGFQIGRASCRERV